MKLRSLTCFHYFFQTPEDGTVIAHDLMQKLGISTTDLIPGAYMDLIESKETVL
jgi:hypothetical protein